jgi:hypothetical protein
MQREKIEFPTNQPVIVKLDFDAEGVLKPGKFGDQYMYTCDDDARIMFVDPPVREAILRTGAQAGDEIAITRREVREGNKRAVRWEVAKVEEEPPPPADPPPPPPQPARTAPAAPAPAPQPAAAAAPGAAQLADAITAAIDAAVVTERHAAQRGLALRWTSEDVRAMALSLYIDSRRSRS